MPIAIAQNKILHIAQLPGLHVRKRSGRLVDRLFSANQSSLKF